MLVEKKRAQIEGKFLNGTNSKNKIILNAAVFLSLGVKDRVAGVERIRSPPKGVSLILGREQFQFNDI